MMAGSVEDEGMAIQMDRIAAFLKGAVAALVLLLVTGMLAPPNLGREYGAAFEAVFPRLAEEHDLPLYPFFLDGVAGEALLNQGDGIHPTEEGIAIIVENILPTITD